MRSGPQSVWWALFGLKGRIRRATYALGVVLLLSIFWAFIALVTAAPDGSGLVNPLAFVLGLFVIISAYCTYALAHKRFHDLGYPGVAALLLIVLQFIFPPLGWVPYLLLGIVPGQPEDNAYGPPPVGPGPER